MAEEEEIGVFSVGGQDLKKYHPNLLKMLLKESLKLAVPQVAILRFWPWRRSPWPSRPRNTSAGGTRPR